MYNWKVISVLLVSLLAAGCTTTPKLGYPVDLVTRPAKVTLFSTIVKKGIFKYQLDIISRGLWDLFNKKTYEEVLGQISPGPFQEMLNNLFIKVTTNNKKDK